MIADVAGSDFLKGVEYVVAGFYVAVGIIAAVLIWSLIAVYDWFVSIWAARKSEVEPSLNDFRAAIQLACQSQNAGRIQAGRQQVMSWRRAWVVARMEQIAAESLDLSDSWQYRRLLELATLLDAQLLQAIVNLGVGMVDGEVLEAAQDYRR